MNGQLGRRDKVDIFVNQVVDGGNLREFSFLHATFLLCWFSLKWSEYALR